MNLASFKPVACKYCTYFRRSLGGEFHHACRAYGENPIVAFDPITGCISSRKITAGKLKGRVESRTGGHYMIYPATEYINETGQCQRFKDAGFWGRLRNMIPHLFV